MPRVLILVEGQTEEVFVRGVLAPHLVTRGVHLHTTIVATRRVHSGGHFKGGITRYERVASDIRKLLGDTDAKLVTTMFDFYGLPDDFPGQASKPPGTCYQRVAHVEDAFRASIGNTRFEPYLALHEFEAMVFVDPRRAEWVFANAAVVTGLEQIGTGFSSPEEIDEGPDTAPSKRIRGLFPGYQKPFHGPMVAEAIGLDKVRARCPHFDEWLAKLEML